MKQKYITRTLQLFIPLIILLFLAGQLFDTRITSFGIGVIVSFIIMKWCENPDKKSSLGSRFFAIPYFFIKESSATCENNERDNWNDIPKCKRTGKACWYDKFDCEDHTRYKKEQEKQRQQEELERQKEELRKEKEEARKRENLKDLEINFDKVFNILKKEDSSSFCDLDSQLNISLQNLSIKYNRSKDIQNYINNNFLNSINYINDTISSSYKKLTTKNKKEMIDLLSTIIDAVKEREVVLKIANEDDISASIQAHKDFLKSLGRIKKGE